MQLHFGIALWKGSKYNSLVNHENSKQINKPIRVAQVIGRLCKGGVEAVINNYYMNLDHEKIQFDFYVDNNSPLRANEKLIEMGAKFYFIPSYKHPFAYVKTLKRAFKEQHYDIVHTNMGTLAPLSMYAAKKAGVPVRIAHIHSTSSPKNKIKNALKLLLRPFGAKYATNLAACSKQAAEWMYKKEYDKGEVKIISNAINVEQYSFNNEEREALRAELGITNKIVIGNVGRLCKDKNQSFLLDVFAKVCKKEDNAILMLIGIGEMEDKLKEKAKSLNLEDKVLFLGSKDDVYKYYQAMDVFAFTSLYEGFGLVGIEAQAAGLPCVFADTIPKEAIVLDSTSSLSLSDSIDLWEDTILAKSKLKRENSTKAIKKAGFDIKAEARGLEEYYESLMVQQKQ